jgi:hypothetical protein
MPDSTVTAIRVIVEANFIDSWYTPPAAGNWTDITNHVRSWQTSQRADDQGVWRAATATLTLNNRDRDWEPGYSSQARIGLPIRISVHTDGAIGVTRYLFCGLAESFVAQYVGGDGDSVCTLEATSEHSVLAGLRCTAAQVDAGYAGEQIAQILTSVGFPALAGIVGGSSHLSAHTPDSTESVLATIERIIRSEGGTFWLAPSEVTGWSSGWVFGRFWFDWTEQVTFGDSTDEIPYIEVAPTINADSLINQGRVTRVGSTVQSANNTASIRAYGARAWVLDDALLATDGECLDRANHAVNMHATPTAAISETACVIRKGSSWEHCADPILNHLAPSGKPNLTVATINRRPNGGAVQSFVCRYQGASWSGLPGGPVFVTFYWTTAHDEDYWLLGDANLGLLGDTTRLGW